MQISKKWLFQVVNEEITRAIIEYGDPMADPELVTKGEFSKAGMDQIVQPIITQINQLKADSETLWRFLEEEDGKGTLRRFLTQLFVGPSLGALMGMIAAIDSAGAIAAGVVALPKTVLLLALIGAGVGGLAALSLLKEAVATQNQREFNRIVQPYMPEWSQLLSEKPISSPGGK